MKPAAAAGRAGRALLAGVTLLIALGAAGCVEELDPPWQLDHDRIVAVRATPPAIEAGGRAELDALIALEGGATSERSPEIAAVVSPMSLAGAVAPEGGKWIVTAPDAAKLEQVRAELGLTPGAPVPLIVGVAYGGTALKATKTILLGVAGQNPSLDAMMIDGAPADTKTEIVVGKLVDVPLSVAAEQDDDVNWLTSCGTMHDFDLPQAYLRVELEDPTAGELAVIRRDPRGGVAWRVWQIRAE
ncbi:MAG TPA: hypothetical protein VNO30_44600 [Kofleriaceae bacterium]|nr:hypothetical protein [Kofleriaceae bacterium]